MRGLLVTINSATTLMTSRDTEGEVWKGLLDEHDHHGSYMVAIKTAKSKSAADYQTAADELIAEALIMAQVGLHPNVRCSFSCRMSHLRALLGFTTTCDK
jgi:hypothetical protein